jgi:hypothetical protein
MAFASGQRVSAAMLNRITRNDLLATVTADDVVTGSEVDLSGATLSVTTIQANTKLKVTASLDFESTGTTDFTVVKLYVGGVAVSGDMNRRGAGRLPLSKTWNVTVAAASTVTVKLTRQKIISGDTTTIYSTHSTLVVSGNGIS